MWDGNPSALRASPGATSPLVTQVKRETAPGVRAVAWEMCTCRAHACHACVGRNGRQDREQKLDCPRRQVREFAPPRVEILNVFVYSVLTANEVKNRDFSASFQKITAGNAKNV